MKATTGIFLASAILIILAVICCILVSLLAIGGVVFSARTVSEDTDIISTLIPILASPTPESTPVIDAVPVQPEAYQNLKRLNSTAVRESDPNKLAYQFGLTDMIQEVRADEPPDYNPGDIKEFWAFNNDTNKPYQLTARLGCEREHLYFWVGEDVHYQEKELQALCDAFELKIYPTNREFFGSEWSPGIDNDPHVYVLFAKGMGSVGGYFSSSDSFLPEVHQYSNAHEIIFISADYNSLSDDYTYGVLAHEFQHMIHFYQDRNEDGWVNEGFSELAALLNSYNPGGMDYIFLDNPDWQLNTWPVDSYQTRPSYGASFLFITYVLERFGEKITQQLVNAPENGFAGVDAVFTRNSIRSDDVPGSLTSEEFFADWVIANYLNDDSAGDGRYAYKYYRDAGTAGPTETINSCGIDWQGRSVAQFGTDYIQIKCSSPYVIEFDGSNMVDLLPASPYSGSFAYWSNRGDDSNMTLSKEFDLSGVEEPVRMTFWTWYDIETDYDYLYVEASLDGERWEILQTESGTDYNPSGNSYGWGYNGQSNSWIQESVDISAYAGERVFIRFEYVTDPAVNGEGLLVDDIAIQELGYFTDFETDDGGWIGDGFVKVSSSLPQTFRVSLIKYGDETTVEQYQVESSDTLRIPVDGSEIKESVIVISGTTRFTRTPAAYQFKISQE